MSIYDILMLIVFFGAIFFGWWKGLAWQVASFASVCVSYFVAYNFHGAVSPYLEIAYPWNKFGAMLILFLGTSLVIWIGFGYVRSSIDKMKLDGFDHQSGAVLGAIKGALLCMLVTLFAVTLLPDSFSNNIIHSRSGNFIARSLNQLSFDGSGRDSCGSLSQIKRAESVFRRPGKGSNCTVDVGQSQQLVRSRRNTHDQPRSFCSRYSDD